MKTAIRLGEALVTPVADILKSMIELSLENQKKAIDVLADKMSREAFIQEFKVLEIKMPRRIGKTIAILQLCRELKKDILVIGRGIHPPAFIASGAKESYCLNKPMELFQFVWYELVIVDNAAILNQDEKDMIIKNMVEASNMLDPKLLIFVG